MRRISGHPLLTIVIVCYFAAFLLELFRLMKRNGWGVAAAFVGFVLHSVLILQNHILAEHPIGGAQMYFLLSAWGFIVIYFTLSRIYAGNPFGFFLFPAAMVMLHGSIFTASVIEKTSPPLAAVMKMSHAGMFLFATLTSAVCAAAGIFYLLQNNLLQRKRFNRTSVKLPPLEWSYSICRFAFMSAAVFILIGILLSVPMNLMLGKAPSIGSDPLFIGLLFLFFLLFVPLSSDIPARTLHWTKTPLVTAWTFTAVLFLAFLLTVAVFFDNAHWR